MKSMRDLFFVILAVLVTGCSTVIGTTIDTANKIDQSRDRKQLNNLVVEHLNWVRELQTQGEPLGDYLWAKANEDGLIENPIQDPATLKTMYAEAAGKGSVDAQIWLAYKQFLEGQPRSFGRTEQEMAEKESIWRKGLAMMEKATRRRCFYAKPYIFAPHNKRCLAPRVAADDIWPEFRDGYTYPKDIALRDYWYDKAIACEASPEFQQAMRNCSVFGRTNYRAKD